MLRFSLIEKVTCLMRRKRDIIDTDFHNIMIAYLFKCMCMNGTLHIILL
jgi:hypothetical protein